MENTDVFIVVDFFFKQKKNKNKLEMFDDEIFFRLKNESQS